MSEETNDMIKQAKSTLSKAVHVHREDYDSVVNKAQAEALIAIAEELRQVVLFLGSYARI
jgi:hypothetical protein